MGRIKSYPRNLASSSGPSCCRMPAPSRVVRLLPVSERNLIVREVLALLESAFEASGFVKSKVCFPPQCASAGRNAANDDEFNDRARTDGDTIEN